MPLLYFYLIRIVSLAHVALLGELIHQFVYIQSSFHLSSLLFHLTPPYDDQKSKTSSYSPKYASKIHKFLLFLPLLWRNSTASLRTSFEFFILGQDLTHLKELFREYRFLDSLISSASCSLMFLASLHRGDQLLFGL